MSLLTAVEAPPTLLPLLLDSHRKIPAHACTVQLSAHLWAGVSRANNQQEALSTTIVAQHGLSNRKAWDTAARTLLKQCETRQGTRFYSRRIDSHIIEFGENAAPAHSWLAHPYCFSVLFRHAQRLLECSKPVFLLEEGGQLFAASTLPKRTLSFPASMILGYQRGFPVHLNH